MMNNHQLLPLSYNVLRMLRLFIVCPSAEKQGLAYLQAGQVQGVPPAQQRLLSHQLSCQHNGSVLPQDHHLSRQLFRGAAGQSKESAGEWRTLRRWAG